MKTFKYLSEEILKNVVGGDFQIVNWKTGNVVETQGNILGLVNSSPHIDPYGASEGRLTAGDGSKVPGVAKFT